MSVRHKYGLSSLFRFAILLVAGFTAIFVIGYGIGPELAWPIALFQYVPYVFLLPPTFAVVVLSFTLSIWWRVAAIASALAIVVIVMDLRINTGDEGTGDLRLMTHNIKSYLAVNEAGGMWPIKLEISKYDPDIVLLQDARALIAILATSPDAAQLIFGTRELYVYGQYLVASRHALKGCAPGFISFRGQPHTYVHCIVNVQGRELDLFNVHFLTPRDGLNALRHNQLHGINEWKQNISDRMTQAKTLAQILSIGSRTAIVAGDFNAPAQSLAVRELLKDNMRNAFSTAGNGFGFSFGHSLWPGVSSLRIDHILVGSEIGVATCFVGDGTHSSHRAVVADLTLRWQ